MTFEKKPSFERAWESLDPPRQRKAQEALGELVGFFEGGSRPEGLGLKKLRENFWEIRTDLKDRILFRMEKGHVEFILVGNHDEIRRILKRL